MTERNPMTDKLQDVAEQFIAESERELYAHRNSGGGPIVWAVPVADLRAFLAKFVLCEKDPAAWRYTLEYGAQEANSMVFPDQRRYPFGVCGADYLARNDDGVSYIRETDLHAPATKVPE